MRVRRSHERPEQRMRLQRLGLELRMKLACQEPGMVRSLDNFHILAVRRTSGNAESRVGQRLFVLAVEFVAVAVALADIRRAVGLEGRGIFLDLAGPRSEAHG